MNCEGREGKELTHHSWCNALLHLQDEIVSHHQAPSLIEI